jgi:hypothetical protein
LPVEGEESGDVEFEEEESCVAEFMIGDFLSMQSSLSWEYQRY